MVAAGPLLQRQRCRCRPRWKRPQQAGATACPAYHASVMQAQQQALQASVRVRSAGFFSSAPSGAQQLLHDNHQQQAVQVGCKATTWLPA